MESRNCLQIPWKLILDNSMFGEIYKFLVVDFETNSFEVIKSDDSIYTENQKFSDWLDMFVQNDGIYPADVQTFVSFVSMENLRNHFKESSRYIYLRYRRKNSQKGWSWATMDLFVYPSDPIDTSKILLIVRDIDSEYSLELSRQKVLESKCNIDELTGIHNRYSYVNYCRNLMETKLSCGIIYCDLNGLKYTNDNFGHEEGDMLIKRMSWVLTSFFRQSECFRIGGDEFIVVLHDIEKKNFLNRANAFVDSLCSMSGDFLLASTGFAWCETSDKIEETVRVAEKIMYENKAKFHSSEIGKIICR